MNYSIIITAWKEPKQVEKSINVILKNGLKDFEIIVVAPDKETLEVVKKFKKKNIWSLKDLGHGKPEALNLVVSKAKGEILILTDGDVFMGKDSLKYLVEPFKEEKIGAVSGRPVSIDSKSNKYGFWSHLLTEVAHERRLIADKKNKNFFCSGYLFAIRKKIFPEIPVEILSDDGYISLKVYSKGYRIGYSPKSEVYVKYPKNFSDWVLQKKRSAGGYNQIKKIEGVSMRSFSKEAIGGLVYLKTFLKQVKGLKELVWVGDLFISRIYLWILIYRDINLKKKSHKEIWKRIESSK